MRRQAALLLTIPLLAGCDLEILGPTELCVGGCWEPTPEYAVSGSVFVGEYPAEADEVRILLYAPSDTLTPIDSIDVWGGWYHRYWPTYSAPAMCDYVARARLWSGAVTSLTPLFPESGCAPSVSATSGPSFRLPAYEPLSEPFVVGGRVLVDGGPVAPSDVEINIQRRSSDPSYINWFSVTSDEEGRWTFETTDGGQRYFLCRNVIVRVRHVATAAEQHAYLDPSADACDTAREAPDVRFGSSKAAIVLVRRDTAPGVVARVGAGVARVSLASPADSSIVGDTFETLDDGRAHVWFPAGTASPSCDWLVRAELGGRVQYQPLRSPYDQSCPAEYYHTFDFLGS